MDESFFEQSQALFGVVREVVPLPNGDLLLGIADIAEDASELSADNRQMTYHRLSDLQHMYMPLDAQELDPNGLISDKLSMQYAQRRSDEEVWPRELCR